VVIATAIFTSTTLLMNAAEKELSPQESLKLIASMIETTKNSISDRSHYFLLWGWAVVVGCLLQYYLKTIVNYPHHYYAWFITPVALFVHFIFIYRDNKKEQVKTYINEATMYLWTAIGLCFIVLAFVFTKIGWQYCYPFYIMLYAVGTYVSGLLLKFRPMIVGGLLCFPLVVLCVFQQYDTQMLTTTFAIIISYIIPGYWLRYQYKKHKSLQHA